MQIYDGNCGPLTGTVGFLLEPYEGKGYHLYQDNYYNSVQLTEEFLQKSNSVCDTIRINRSLPRDMIEEATMLKKGEVTFHRKQNVLLLSFQDKHLVHKVSALHTAAIADDDTSRPGKTKKKPKCVVDYNTYTHGVDSADQYLAYYPFIRKTVKWPKKVFSIQSSMRLFHFQNVTLLPECFLDFIVDMDESLIHTTEDLSSSSDGSQESGRTVSPTPSKHAPKLDPPGRLDGKMKKHKLVQIQPTKVTKHQKDIVKCAYGKISIVTLYLYVHSLVLLFTQKAATHNITP
jgi:hypothetical protein